MKLTNRELDDTFVSSDIHLNHANIISYCGRPWLKPGDFLWEEPVAGLHRKGKWASQEIKHRRVHEMNEGLVEGWNQTVEPHQTVYHIGDFCMSRSGLKPFEWEQRLNGKIVHIVGNHDRSNGVRGLKCAVLEVTGHAMFLVHRPVYRVEELPDFCDIVLCGHVHEAWDHKWVGDRLLLNVGVDVRGFKPWSLRLAIDEAERLQDEARSR